MSFNFQEFKKFAERLEKVAKTIEKEIDNFFYEMALKCLARTMKRTPVDTGDLRKQWALSSIVRTGAELTITIFNPLEYASFVEYGHRMTKHFVPGEWKGNRFIYNPDAETGVIMGVKTQWVEGKYMCTISMKEISDIIPKEWDKRFKKIFGDL